MAIIETVNGVRFLVDDNRYRWLMQFTWTAIKRRRAWYACTWIGPPHNQQRAWMHRIVAHTPPGMVCHHKNRDTQDNRLENLENLTKKAHDLLHRDNGITVVFDPERKNWSQDTGPPEKTQQRASSVSDTPLSTATH